MKETEKFRSENSRLNIFRFFYGVLFILLFTFLTKLQLFQSEQFEDKERKQGQRRILRPGSRGDVLDTEGRLLIGNKAQFSAVIHLDRLKSEIWEKKVLLKNQVLNVGHFLIDQINL